MDSASGVCHSKMYGSSSVHHKTQLINAPFSIYYRVWPYISALISLFPFLRYHFLTGFWPQIVTGSLLIWANGTYSFSDTRTGLAHASERRKSLASSLVTLHVVCSTKSSPTHPERPHSVALPGRRWAPYSFIQSTCNQYIHIYLFRPHNAYSYSLLWIS